MFPQKRALYLSIRSERVIREKRAFNFRKNCNFVKNRKNARKTRVLYFGELALSEMEKAHFFFSTRNGHFQNETVQLHNFDRHFVNVSIKKSLLPQFLSCAVSFYSFLNVDSSFFCRRCNFHTSKKCKSYISISR